MCVATPRRVRVATAIVVAAPATNWYVAEHHLMNHSQVMEDVDYFLHQTDTSQLYQSAPYMLRRLPKDDAAA